MSILFGETNHIIGKSNEDLLNFSQLFTKHTSFPQNQNSLNYRKQKGNCVSYQEYYGTPTHTTTTGSTIKLKRSLHAIAIL